MGDILEIITPKALDTQRFSAIDELSRDALLRLAFLLCGAPEESVRDASHSLKLSSKQSQRLMKLCVAIDENLLKDLTESTARRILAAYREDTLAATEIASHLYEIDAASVEILRRVVAKNPPVTLDRLAVNGSDLIREGIAKGRGVGIILARLLDEVIECPEKNDRETLLKIAKKCK